MGSGFKTAAEVKWATRQRLQYIELMAYYTGVVSRSDVAGAFGISDAAATKDLKLYGDLAPDNLVYSQKVFGFVPGNQFTEVFADLSPASALPMIAANLPSTGGPLEGKPLYGIPTEGLPLPSRLPARDVLAQTTRAIRNGKQLRVSYRSLSDRDSDAARVIEPHSLVNTGLRWHVRAYNHETCDFRDFVLSRLAAATLLDTDAESSLEYDDDWVERVSLKLAPHPGLYERKRRSLLTDYGVNDDGIIELQVRRALIGYLLKTLSVDTTREHALNPNAYQLVVVNRDEIEPFAGWAFLQES